MKRKIFIVAVLCLLAAIGFSQKPLHNGWYSYRQLLKRNYICTPFKGRVFIRATKDTNLVNIKPIKNDTKDN